MYQLMITENHEQNRAALLPQAAGKDQESRLLQYCEWLQESGTVWHEPDLASYRDHLLQRLQPTSAAAHLATIRGRYKNLLKSNRVRDGLEIMVREALRAEGKPDSLAEVEAGVNRKLARLMNGTDPGQSHVTIPTIQDEADSKHTRLTSEQASRLLKSPGIDTLQGLRDSALLALMVSTGIRAAEAAGLVVSDLRQTLGGELALLVREGKGMKQRMIPYGEMDWVLILLDAWLQQAEITAGPVFRGIYKGGRTVRSQALSTRSIEKILAGYPVTINGGLTVVSPHDLRRTYARLMYQAGVDLISIQQNLGHASVKTTQGYIGTLSAAERRAPALIQFDLTGLQQKVLR